MSSLSTDISAVVNMLNNCKFAYEIPVDSWLNLIERILPILATYHHLLKIILSCPRWLGKEWPRLVPLLSS